MSWVFHTKNAQIAASSRSRAVRARACVHIYKYKAMEMSRLPTPPLSPSSTRLFDPLDPLHPNRVIAVRLGLFFIVGSNANSMGRCRDRPTGVCQYDPFEKDGVRTRDAATDRKTHLSRPGANNSLIAVSYEARKQGVEEDLADRRRDGAVRCVWMPRLRFGFFLSLSGARILQFSHLFFTLFLSARCLLSSRSTLACLALRSRWCSHF